MKRKRDDEQNPFVNLWNEFLFARYFEYESDADVYEVADAFEGLAHERDGFWWGMSKEARVEVHPNDKGLDFDVQAKRRQAGQIAGILTARATGDAEVDSGTGRVIVRGKVTFGRLFHLMLIGYLLVTFTTILPLSFAGELTVLPVIVIWVTVFSMYWWRIYADRNNMAYAIEDAMEALDEANAKRARGNLAQSNDSDEAYNSDAASQARRNQH